MATAINRCLIKLLLLTIGKISGIVEQENIPAGTAIIDLSDKTVLPGLIDCHMHVLLQGDVTSEDYDGQILKESIAYRTLLGSVACRIALMNGFTSIRDLGTEGAMYADVDLKMLSVMGYSRAKNVWATLCYQHNRALSCKQ